VLVKVAAAAYNPVDAAVRAGFMHQVLPVEPAKAREQADAVHDKSSSSSDGVVLPQAGRPSQLVLPSRPDSPVTHAQPGEGGLSACNG
jgi:hypothetical protein